MVVLVGVSAFWTDVAKSLLNDRCRNRNWRWSGRVRFIGQRVYAKSMIVKIVFLRVFQGRVVKGLITELMGLKKCNRNTFWLRLHDWNMEKAAYAGVHCEMCSLERQDPMQEY